MQSLAARTPAMTLHNFYEREYKLALEAAREENIFTITAKDLAWPLQNAFAVAVEAMRRWQPIIPHMRPRVPGDSGMAVMQKFAQESHDTRDASRSQSQPPTWKERKANTPPLGARDAGIEELVNSRTLGAASATQF